MNKETITQHESGNDGRTINLYYDDMAGLYLAFGLSAYYVTMVTDPYMSYSYELQMPVALLRRGHILALRQGLTKLEHKQRSFYRFQMKTMVGDAGYDRWEHKVREKHDRVYR